MAALDGAPSVRQPGGDASEVGFQGEAASVAQIEGMYQHLEQALVEIGFLDASNPRKLMPRLKRMFARAARTGRSQHPARHRPPHDRPAPGRRR
jgi:tRNA/rRNA methyltransferase